MMSLIVMATGGTGGHIYPATATGKELQSRGHEVVLLGQKGGMEERVSAEQGIEFIGVDAGKLARSGQGKADPRELIKAGKGIVQARAELARLRPSAVVGYGGFASLPGILAAQSLGIATILHEQNALLGLTQKLAVGKAKAIGTCYEEVRGLAASKATLVGMPIRENKMTRTEAIAKLGLQSELSTLLIMGGSQGSLFLNNNLPDILRELKPRLGSVQVIHSTGTRWVDEVQPKVADLPWYKAVGYLDAVAAWSAADLAVTRAGTSTLAEAAFHGVPLVMIPLPESAENHQLHNALSVEQKGAGKIVEQKDLTERLGLAVLECASELTGFKEAALKRAHTGAAGRFASLIERHL